MEEKNWLDFCAKQPTENLFQNLQRLDAREARSLAAILAHLAELDTRKAAEDRGYPSLFVYCTKTLGYSEAEAYLRIRTARAAKNYRCILTMIARRHIHVTAVARLAPHLNSQNYRSLLGKASRRTLEELDRLVASLSPLPEKRPVIRTLSASKPLVLNGTNGNTHELFLLNEMPQNAQEYQKLVPSGPLAAAMPSPPKPPIPMREGRVLFHFAAGESLRAKYKRARECLRHKYPEGRPEQIFDDALEALLDRKDPDRRIARKLIRLARNKKSIGLI